MPKYHVSESRGVEVCNARKRCRLGWPMDDHPEKPEDALAYYNKTLSAEIDHLKSIKNDPQANRKFMRSEINVNPKYIDQTIQNREDSMARTAEKVAETLTKMNEEAARKKAVSRVKPKGVTWSEWSAPKESEIIVPPAKSDPQGGYAGGMLWVGGKSEGLSYGDATPLIRTDLKEAVAKGELPKDIALSVRNVDGNTIVKIGLKENGKTVAWPTQKDGWEREHEEKFRELENYVQRIGDQYSRKDINGMVDYFNTSNTTRVQALTKWDLKK